VGERTEHPRVVDVDGVGGHPPEPRGAETPLQRLLCIHGEVTTVIIGGWPGDPPTAAATRR
jgi:hypothetical protein